MSTTIEQTDEIEGLSVWECYQGGLAAVVIAVSHNAAMDLLAEKHGARWSAAAISRITRCAYPMRPRVVMIGGKA